MCSAAQHIFIEIGWANWMEVGGVLNPDVGHEDAFKLQLLLDQYPSLISGCQITEFIQKMKTFWYQTKKFTTDIRPKNLQNETPAA